MRLERPILQRSEVDDFLFTLSPRAYLDSIDPRPLFPWQADILDDPGQYLCVDAARQAGKGVVIGMLAAHSARFFPGSLTVLVTPTEKQTLEDMLKTKTVISLDRNYPEVVRSSDSLIWLSNGSRIMIVTATEESARGFSQYDQGPRLIILDEASRIEEIVFTSGILPMLTGNMDAILAVFSTPRGRTGFFYDAMQDKEFSRYHVRSPWDLIDLEWKLVPAAPEATWRKKCAEKGVKGYYSPRDRWLDQQKFFLRKMGPLLYRQEKLGEFVEPIDQVFSYEEIDSMFNHKVPAKPLELEKIPAVEGLRPMVFRDE